MSSLNFKDVLNRIDHLVIKIYLYTTEALYLVSTSPDTAKYPNMIAGPCKTNIIWYNSLCKGYTEPKKDFQTKLTAVRVWVKFTWKPWNTQSSIPGGKLRMHEHKGPQREEGGAFGWLSERSAEKTSCPRTF